VQNCPPGSAIVHVRQESTDGPPLLGAAVTIKGPKNVDRTTDASGDAHFAGIPPGSYTVSARKDHYTPDPGTEAIAVPARGTQNITLVKFLSSGSSPAKTARVDRY